MPETKWLFQVCPLGHTWHRQEVGFPFVTDAGDAIMRMFFAEEKGVSRGTFIIKPVGCGDDPLNTFFCVGYVSEEKDGPPA